MVTESGVLFNLSEKFILLNEDKRKKFVIGSKTVLRSVSGLDQNTLDKLIYLFSKKCQTQKIEKLAYNSLKFNILIFKIKENTVYLIVYFKP